MDHSYGNIFPAQFGTSSSGNTEPLQVQCFIITEAGAVIMDSLNWKSVKHGHVELSFTTASKDPLLADLTHLSHHTPELA